MKIHWQGRDLAVWLESTIKWFVKESPLNSLRNQGNEQAWSEPLVGFSRGGDELYEEYREHIGAFYWTPLEIFGRSFPKLSTAAEQLTVISWILPQTDSTKAANRKENRYPSEKWVRAYVYGEEFNVALRKHVVEMLDRSGFAAVAPMLSPLWRRETSPQYGFASTWSERHAAYAAGLGTFGLCDGLITPKGKAMRCGSVVAGIQIPPTPRPYEDHRAYCLFFSQGTCGKCIQRCPAQAITETGHDKIRCKNYTRGAVLEHVKVHYGLEAHPCGLCQTGIPCESKIPTTNDLG